MKVTKFLSSKFGKVSILPKQKKATQYSTIFSPFHIVISSSSWEPSFHYFLSDILVNLSKQEVPEHNFKIHFIDCDN